MPALHSSERRWAEKTELHVLCEAQVLASSKCSRVMLVLPQLAARAHAEFGVDKALTPKICQLSAAQGVPATGPGQGLPVELPQLQLPAQLVAKRAYGISATGHSSLFPEAEVEEYKRWRVTPVRLDRWVGETAACREREAKGCQHSRNLACRSTLSCELSTFSGERALIDEFLGFCYNYQASSAECTAPRMHAKQQHHTRPNSVASLHDNNPLGVQPGARATKPSLVWYCNPHWVLAYLTFLRARWVGPLLLE